MKANRDARQYLGRLPRNARRAEKSGPLPKGALVFSRDGHSVYRVNDQGALVLAPDVPWEDPEKL